MIGYKYKGVCNFGSDDSSDAVKEEHLANRFKLDIPASRKWEVSDKSVTAFLDCFKHLTHYVEHAGNEFIVSALLCLPESYSYKVEASLVVLGEEYNALRASGLIARSPREAILKRKMDREAGII